MHELKLSEVNAELAKFDVRIVVDEEAKQSPSPPETPPPKTPPVEDNIFDVDWKDIVHHYNPKSFADGTYKATGQGVSIVFCVGRKFDVVIFNGAKPTFLSGEVIAKKGGKTWRFTIPPGGKSYLDYKGHCFGKR